MIQKNNKKKRKSWWIASDRIPYSSSFLSFFQKTIHTITLTRVQTKQNKTKSPSPQAKYLSSIRIPGPHHILGGCGQSMANTQRMRQSISWQSNNTFRHILKLRRCGQAVLVTKKCLIDGMSPYSKTMCPILIKRLKDAAKQTFHFISYNSSVERHHHTRI